MSNKGQIAPLYIILKQWKWNGCGSNNSSNDPESTSLYKVIVFVGQVSAAIQKELAAFTKKFDKSYTNAELDKYFGKGFVKTITCMAGGDTKKGGKSAAKNKNDTDASNSIASLSDFEGGADAAANKEADIDRTDESAISFGDIFAADSEGATSILDALKIVDTEKQEEQFAAVAASTKSHLPISTAKSELPFTGNPTLEFVYQAVWSVDTPFDLRQKIWTHIGIPMFCQHLTITSATGDVIPLYYNMQNNNKLLRLSLADTLLTKEKYNGIPILNQYYAFRDFFFIQTLDSFELLEKFVNIGTSSLVIDMYDARDFLCSMELSALKKDKNMEQLLYYGFFILFWPMFTEDAFHEYIVANGSIPELSKMYPDLLPRQASSKAANEKEHKLFNLFYTLTESGSASDKKALAEIEKYMYVRIAKNNIVNYAYGDNRRIILSLRNLFDKLVLSEQVVAIKYSALYADQRIDLHKTYKTAKELTQELPINSLVIRCVYSETITHDKQKHLAQSTMDVHIFENGNYYVKCVWDDSTHYTFDAAIKVAAEFINKKIIAPINSMKGEVVHHSYELIPISQGVVKFANISAEIFYRKNLDTRNLHLFRLVLQEFYEAELFSSDLSKQDDEFNFTYYLRKGSHQQDRELLHKKYLSIANTYEYLTKASIATKWAQVYVRNKALNISLRNTDLKFALAGMWDTEFNIAYSYILLALYMLYSNEVQKNQKYNAAISKDAKSDAHSAEKRNIKSLKQIDPVLYDFKRYNSNLVYSKICQKPNQPKILTIDEYKSLSEKERTKAIKYWNFTTQTETYYYAPNPKYPFINFIVGKHPLNYCIPCAKKTSFEKKSNVKHKIYETCMKEHAYEQGRKNIITDTRYIMNYGKPIDAGRLCKLPENTLEPFLYEGFYENSGFEEECYQSDKFFLVGVEQQWEGLRNMGILNVISAALEMSVKDFMAAIKKKIVANPTVFSILQNGKILRDFYDYKEFVDMITKIFITHSLVDDEWLTLDWMGIFADILFYYFNVVIVEFTDTRNRDLHEADVETNSAEPTATESATTEAKSDKATAAESSAATKKIPRSKSAKVSKKSPKVDKATAKLIAKSQIEELMPGDFVELKINQRLDVITGDAGQQYKYILILTKHTAVYPIYLVNPVVYFKTKVVNKRIYERADNVIGILGKFLLYAKELTAKQAAEAEPEVDTLAQLTSATTTAVDTKQKYVASYYTTLSALSEFLEYKSASKYTLAKFYVNAHNLCYYVEIRDKSSNSIYIPVSLTNWSPRKGVEIEYKPYSYSGKMDIKTLNRFLTEYNNWIQTHSNGGNDGVRIDKWIARKGKVFGFMFGALNYYFDDIAESAATAIKKAPVWNMLYDLADINKQIHTNAPIKSDPLVKDISDGFYNNHLYQLLLLEFNTLFAREKNVELRTKLKKLIINYSKSTLVELFEDILKILDTYYADFIPVAPAAASTKSTKTETNAKKGKADSQSNKSAEELKAEETAVIWKTLKLEDYNRLIEAINSGIVNFMDKADIYRNIDQAVFNFDKMAINRFKTMTRDQVKRELTGLAKKIVQVGTPPKVAELPNILVPCTTSSAYYCRSNKLVMPEKKLNSLLDILVADIKNPMKEKWIFSPLFNDSIINFLKFEYRPLETISIELA